MIKHCKEFFNSAPINADNFLRDKNNPYKSEFVSIYMPRLRINLTYVLLRLLDMEMNLNHDFSYRFFKLCQSKFFITNCYAIPVISILLQNKCVAFEI